NDPRIIGTIEAIQKHLTRDRLLLRYNTRSKVDGLPGSEGCFIACSFWLVYSLKAIGRHDEAMELYNYLQSLRNDVGLFAEEYSTIHKRMVGNFPQGLSHIAHINAAMGYKLPKT
ncbi:MAG: glycoside hydrolase family 15 protein, partial [Candidatus Caldatribacteriota bacterium]